MSNIVLIISQQDGRLVLDYTVVANECEVGNFWGQGTWFETQNINMN